MCNLKRGSPLPQGCCPAQGFTVRDRQQADLTPLTLTARCALILHRASCSGGPEEGGRRRPWAGSWALVCFRVEGGAVTEIEASAEEEAGMGAELVKDTLVTSDRNPIQTRLNPTGNMLEGTKGRSHKGAGVQAPQHQWALRVWDWSPSCLRHLLLAFSLCPGPYWFSAATQGVTSPFNSTLKIPRKNFTRLQLKS